jgi:predicted transcriptional regulator
MILSLRPSFASLIYSGSKAFEFRRVRMAATVGDRVLIYESAPVGRVTGEFVVGDIVYGPPGEILKMAGSRAGAGAAGYLQGCDCATALLVTCAVEWSEPRDLRELGLARAPQSYQFLGQP